MRNNKRSFVKFLSAFFVVFGFAVMAFGAKALTVQEKLEKGQSLYEAGNYDQAMDNFLDVFVEGNIEQINVANEYVNMIHFKRGGVSTPTRVIYDENIEAQKEYYKQEAKDLQKEINDEYSAAKKYTKEQADLAREQATLAKEQAKEAVNQTEADLLYLQAQEKNRLAQEAAQIDASLKQSQEDFAQQVADSTIPVTTSTEIIVSAPEEKHESDYFISSPYSDQGSDKIIIQEGVYNLEQRDSIIAADVSSMQENIVSRLNSKEGVNVYFRNGQIDAIDIDSNVIFLDDNITFSKEGKEVLQDVYTLMLLAKDPTFVLLPPGSYTDEVSLQGVRQTVALNSYLVNMGLSPAKVDFNMGLINEQPPAKFSNLEGISIVFDYDNAPTLYNKVSDSNSYPVLSLGMYPDKITPALNEGMVIDFSVIETSAPIDNWKLQIIQHASDGKYYIVRQISGTGSIYDQVFWNGKKQFFGPILPAGKYTLLLRATDKKGREKIVRRKVELLSEVKKEEPLIKEVKEAKTSKTTYSGELDYTTPRLWKKPAKVLKKQSALQDFYEESEQSSSYTQTTYNTGAAANATTTTTTTTETTTMTTTSSSSAQNTVANYSANPAQEGAYDASLDDLI